MPDPETKSEPDTPPMIGSSKKATTLPVHLPCSRHDEERAARSFCVLQHLATSESGPHDAPYTTDIQTVQNTSGPYVLHKLCILEFLGKLNFAFISFTRPTGHQGLHHRQNKLANATEQNASQPKKMVLYSFSMGVASSTHRRFSSHQELATTAAFYCCLSLLQFPLGLLLPPVAVASALLGW